MILESTSVLGGFQNDAIIETGVGGLLKLIDWQPLVISSILYFVKAIMDLAWIPFR